MIWLHLPVARITLRLTSSYGVLMSRLWALVLFTIGAAVPLVGGPIVVILSGLGSPYGVNAMALFVVGGIYLPIGLLTAGGASGLRLLVRRLSQGLTLEFAAITLGGAVGALACLPVLTLGYRSWTDALPGWGLAGGGTLGLALVATLLRVLAERRDVTQTTRSRPRG